MYELAIVTSWKLAEFCALCTSIWLGKTTKKNKNKNWLGCVRSWFVAGSECVNNNNMFIPKNTTKCCWLAYKITEK